MYVPVYVQKITLSKKRLQVQSSQSGATGRRMYVHMCVCTRARTMILSVFILLRVPYAVQQQYRVRPSKRLSMAIPVGRTRTRPTTRRLLQNGRYSRAELARGVALALTSLAQIISESCFAPVIHVGSTQLWIVRSTGTQVSTYTCTRVVPRYYPCPYYDWCHA